MLDTGFESMTSVVGGRRLDDRATEAPHMTYRRMLRIDLCYYKRKSFRSKHVRVFLPRHHVHFEVISFYNIRYITSSNISFPYV